MLILAIFEPVAIIIFFVLIVTSSLFPFTKTLFLPNISPVPEIFSIEFFCNKKSTPPVSFLTIPFFLSITFSMSTNASDTLIPNSSLCFILSNTSEDLTNAFVGIHPTFKQVPPTSSFSIITVFKPCFAAYMAATYPPGPAPITVKSHSSSLFIGFSIDPK
ncbi:hypothetical protein SDC9_108799 [bioreactor metagenome]|uniref:Uncharacterized protein n=1 Tax=bioreactor metagenome TaxID=1076179 RepID=A0A645B930_9ZZZZ